MRGLSLFALFAGAIFIALSPIWVRVSEVGPTASAFWRVCLAVPLLWVLFFSLKTKETKRLNTQFPLMLLAGIAFAGDLAFWHWSIKYTSVANSTLLANLASIFVTLAAWLLWKQRPTGLFLAGLAAALLGVTLLVQASLGSSPDALLGDGLGVVTAMFYAWYLLTVKGLRERGAGTLWLMAVTTTITALILLPVAIASGEPLLPASAAGWLKLLGLAWVSHAAGQGGGRTAETGANQQRDAKQGRRQPRKKEARGPLFPKQPGGKRDENGCEVCQQCGVCHGRVLDRPVPEREIARERDARDK